MAGSPGSGASLEGISLGSSEEAELQREGRERRGRKAASPAGLGGGQLERVSRSHCGEPKVLGVPTSRRAT